MKTLLIIPALVMLTATPALAAPTTRTMTVDKPNFEGSKTVTRDPETRTVARDTEVTRKSDGATATRSYDRAPTESGMSASGSATGFNGKTRSFEVDRSRTDTGYVASGTATGGNGGTYALSASRDRTETGYVSNRNVTNGAGETVYNKDKSVSRANGQLSRSVDVTRKQGFRPRRARR
ncbi:hypothetical protein [Sphingobium boeckii]|uniref:Endonuclease n=1 Tax=Sphingobium boeckii TaxID=1082345 RepID=A0A7W9AH19_9SPHN|nr:hypothetical protein [Sphingobium boeckii]MBB5685555.1 hypothetical protein [Sphingobium boeckii]